jgi:hypothetical protein
MEQLEQFSEWAITWQGIAWIAVVVMLAELWSFWQMGRSRRRYNAKLEVEARALDKELKAAELARTNPIDFRD